VKGANFYIKKDRESESARGFWAEAQRRR
jgi:hypothetical protein